MLETGQKLKLGDDGLANNIKSLWSVDALLSYNAGLNHSPDLNSGRNLAWNYGGFDLLCPFSLFPQGAFNIMNPLL